MEHKLISYDKNLAPFASDLDQREKNLARKKKGAIKEGTDLI